MKYSFIAQHKRTWPIDLMCRILGVRRNGYYDFQKKLAYTPKDQELIEWIKKIAESSHHTYGSRRMKKALNALGYPIGRSKTSRLMKEAGIWVRYRKKYKVTTNSNHKKPVFENILNCARHANRSTKWSTMKSLFYGSQITCNAGEHGGCEHQKAGITRNYSCGFLT